MLIIGAGVVGLTLAYEYLKKGLQTITIVDKEPQPGYHASGRNSGVLHAGVYYASDSEKAKYCMEGNRIWKQFCLDHDCSLLECGKVIVTRNESELETLHELAKRATSSGSRARIISQKELSDIEPNAKTIKEALFVPETATIAPKEILTRLVDILTASGSVTFFWNQTVDQLETDQRAYLSDGAIIQAEYIINAAGSYSLKLAHQLGLGTQYAFLPFKGLYKKLDASLNSTYNGHIYPVPNIKNPFLGVHFTKGVDGTIYLGPTAIPAFGPENYGALDGLGIDSFAILWRNIQLLFTNDHYRYAAMIEPKYYINRYFNAAAHALVNHLDDRHIVPCQKIGIRPQLIDKDTLALVMDFTFVETDHSLHILNAISPAFTAAPAMAKQLISN